jgi:hypothetical protein
MALVEERRLRRGKVTRMEIKELPGALTVITRGAVPWRSLMVSGGCESRMRKTCVTLYR